MLLKLNILLVLTKHRVLLLVLPVWGLHPDEKGVSFQCVSEFPTREIKAPGEKSIKCGNESAVFHLALQPPSGPTRPRL